MAEQFLEARQIGAGFEQVRGVAVAQRMRVNVLGDAGALCRHTASVPDDFVETGASTRCPSTTPGNTYVTGLIQRQYSRKASSSLGLSGTSRSRLPLPSRICTSIRSYRCRRPSVAPLAAAHAAYRHQDHAIQQVGCRNDHAGYFLLAQNHGRQKGSRERDMLQHIVAQHITNRKRSAPFVEQRSWRLVSSPRTGEPETADVASTS